MKNVVFARSLKRIIKKIKKNKIGKVRKSEFFGKKRTSPKIKRITNATIKNLLLPRDKFEYLIFLDIRYIIILINTAQIQCIIFAKIIYYLCILQPFA